MNEKKLDQEELNENDQDRINKPQEIDSGVDTAKTRVKKKIFDKRHFSIVIPIVIAAGVIAGAGNFLKDLINHESDFYNLPGEMKSLRKYIIPTYRIILGIIAASVIPLFLHFIHSDLLFIDKTKESNIRNNMKVFILFGFCVLAASFSDKFIDRMYSKTIVEQFEDFKESTQKKLKEKDQILAPFIYQNQKMFDNLIDVNDSLGENKEEINEIKDDKNLTPEEAELYFYLYESGGVFKDHVNSQEKLTRSSKAVESLINKGEIIETTVGEKKVLVPKRPIYE